MAWQILVFSVALIPVSLIPTLLREAGLVYFVGALVLSSGFFYYAARLAFYRSNATARRTLFASIVYLPLIFSLLMFS
jgi:heme o synthase